MKRGNPTLRLYMARDFNRCLHFFSGVISSTRVFEMSRCSSCGKSEATISSPWRLKSVLLTFRVWRALNFDRATTTQYLKIDNELIHLIYKQVKTNSFYFTIFKGSQFIFVLEPSTSCSTGPKTNWNNKRQQEN